MHIAGSTIYTISVLSKFDSSSYTAKLQSDNLLGTSYSLTFINENEHQRLGIILYVGWRIKDEFWSRESLHFLGIEFLGFERTEKNRGFTTEIQYTITTNVRMYSIELKVDRLSIRYVYILRMTMIFKIFVQLQIKIVLFIYIANHLNIIQVE